MAFDYVKGFFSYEVLKIALINVVCGILVGACYGFVPVHTTFITISENCTLYESSSACSTVSGTTCLWGFSNATQKDECLFSQPTDCRVYNGTSAATCSQLSYCVWEYADELCLHSAGYTALQSGIFSGAMVVGALIGSFSMGRVVNYLGRKKCVMLCGMCAFVCSLVVHVASYTYLYGLLVPARLFLGVVVGALCCVGPMYVDEMVPDDYRNPVGMLFQVFFTCGMMLASLLGFFLNPTVFDEDVKMRVRLQALDVFPTVCSVVVLATGARMVESTKWVRPQQHHKHIDGVDDVSESDPLVVATKTATGTIIGSANRQSVPVHAALEPSVSWWDMRVELIVAVALGMANQMTGSNAIFNYAPNITKSMNLAPLTGNLLVMAWNFLCSIISVPFSSKYSMRQMFLTATMAASLAGFLTGVPVFPGVTSDGTRSVLAALGIALFIFAYEIGIGTCFYVLAQIVFPKSFRARGSSFAIVSMFLFNIAVTVLFPIAVESLSGGPSGNQDKGMAFTFMFFGVCGLVAFVVLLKLMHPNEEQEEISVKE